MRLRLFLAGLLLTGGAWADGARVWRDTSGKRVSAHFLWADDENVYLKLGNGSEAQVALGRLSNDDLEFVRKWREARRAQGILFEAPLVWEVYRSKNVTAAEAAQAGHYPLSNAANSEGVLRLEFRRHGPPPRLEADQHPVLRLRTADRRDAGTASRITVEFQGKIVGSAGNVGHATTFDIPLAPIVLRSDSNIELTVRCGTDTVMLRTSKAGSGPRLLVAGKKPE